MIGFSSPASKPVWLVYLEMENKYKKIKYSLLVYVPFNKHVLTRVLFFV